MTTREDQREPFVGDRLVHLLRRVERRQQLGLAAQVLFAPDAVDCAVPRRREQPRPGIGGGALARPPLERRRERLLHRVLGEFHVAERAGEDREGAPPLLPEDVLYDEPSPSKTI